MGRNKLKPKLRAFRAAASFVVPKKHSVKFAKEDIQLKRVAAVIPTYKPSEVTLRLAQNLVAWHPNIVVVVVDDCTPTVSEEYKVVQEIKAYSEQNQDVVYLRTPQNKLKAGALNYGLRYLKKISPKPHVVITFDDDVEVIRSTIPHMVHALFSEEKMGAVCSQAHVSNKKKNLLTRLQALEYHGFTVSKIADHGFLDGPLVMQGMLTAFRMEAIVETGGFKPGHLIEDYEMTVQLKKKGWRVGIAKHAVAWTHVPEDFTSLWKQRIRWGYGGLGIVVQHGRSLTPVFQDLIGHTLFIALFALVIASLITTKSHNPSPVLIVGLIILAFAHFLLSLIFNIATLASYKEKDLTDWVIRLSIIPEFIYGNILSLVLIGSYAFFVYNAIVGSMAKKFSLLNKPYQIGLLAFSKIGYSKSWGTRQSPNSIINKERSVMNK